MRLFSVVEIPIKHSSSYNEVIFYMRVLQRTPHQPAENNNDCLPDYFQDKPENSCLSWQKGNKDLKKKVLKNCCIFLEASFDYMQHTKIFWLKQYFYSLIYFLIMFWITTEVNKILTNCICSYLRGWEACPLLCEEPAWKTLCLNHNIQRTQSRLRRNWTFFRRYTYKLSHLLIYKLNSCVGGTPFLKAFKCNLKFAVNFPQTLILSTQALIIIWKYGLNQICVDQVSKDSHAMSFDRRHFVTTFM